MQNNQYNKHRSSWHVTLSVWKALFLREALSRIFVSRTAWFWLIAEPVFQLVFMIFLFSVIRLRVIGGIDTANWIALGMLGFLLFQRPSKQIMTGVKVNKVLFTYRQVKPIDTLLVRAGLEGFIMVLVIISLNVGMALLDYSVMPDDPLRVLKAFVGLWLFGMGFGLVTSVAKELLPGFDKILGFLMKPLMIVSGVIFPIAEVPLPYRAWLMYNPIPHGLEELRLGFASYYHAVPELSDTYLYKSAVIFVFFGFALYHLYSERIATQ